MRQHILDAIRAHARSSPDKCALADTRVSIRYAGLGDFSTRMAIRLCELGCEPGARVAMVAHRRASLVAAILGTFKASCILDPRMPSSRLQYILSDIAPTVVIADDDLRDAVAACLDTRANILMASEIERLLLVDEAQSAPTWLQGRRIVRIGRNVRSFSDLRASAGVRLRRQRALKRRTASR
jgi:acyl-CoA synthetase (AMP-forming)/AMP-acid ligase II